MSAPCPTTAGAVAPPTSTAGLSLAEVIGAGLPLYQKGHTLLPAQWKVLRAILACRTPALGAHGYRCADCGREHVQLHSCRNRHCPRCQGSLAAAWLDKQARALLPVPYFHLVFTLPHGLNPLVRQNRAVLYKLLFDSAAQTLLQFGRRRLGGQIGLTAVLHTWGQTLTDHYHVHCIVTGGAWADPGWRSASPHYLFPVKALSKVFRGKFCSGLEQLLSTGRLELHGELQPLAQSPGQGRLLREAVRTKWVVYAKRPFAGPRQLLTYLSLYTHRVAISERRLLSLNPAQGSVSVSYKDYADGAQRKTMTLALDEFMRRFLLHLLPRRFVKIRHYGILGNHGRDARLERIRALLSAPRPAAVPSPPPLSASTRALLIKLLAQDSFDSRAPRCPFCGSYRLELIAVTRPIRSGSAPLDSS
jgi:DNA-directed RNA polymerase subunit RPC12/RpoP